jgi:hypothetical protein
MNKPMYNNIGVAAIGIQFVLQYNNSMSLAKSLLIMPFLVHKELLNYLSNGNVNTKSLEALIVDKTSCFANFNKRYYDNLCTSLNAVQFLNESELIQIKGSTITSASVFNYDQSMGSRALKISKASKNIASILDDSIEKLYLNLRVEL